MIRHEDVLLWEYAARELDAEEAWRVEVHLEECARCREQLASVEVAREALEASRGALAPVRWQGLDLAVGTMVEQRLNRAARHPWPWRAVGTWLVVAAGALALAFSLAGHRSELERSASGPRLADERPSAPRVVARVEHAQGLERLGPSPMVVRDGAALEPGDVVATGKGGQAFVHLPDSSALSLAGSTQLTLARLETDEVSLELHRGRIAVRAAHVERKGFAVSAGALVVHVVGTLFEVASLGALTEVAVTEGQVRVQLPSGAEALVGARERLTLDLGGRVTRAKSISPAVVRALDEVKRFADSAADPPPPPAVAPAMGGARSPPPLVAAPPTSRLLPRLDREKARARLGKLPDDVLRSAPAPADEAPVAEAPITQRIEPHTELVVEPPAPAAPEPPNQTETEWALPPAALARREQAAPAARAEEPGAEGEWATLGPSAGLRRSGKLVEAERPVTGDLETIFMHRAEAALDKGGCGRFLVGLEDIAQDDTRNPRSELARVLRARCFNLELRPRQAINEYRKYLEEYPRGRFVFEAKEAIGAE